MTEALSRGAAFVAVAISLASVVSAQDVMTGESSAVLGDEIADWDANADGIITKEEFQAGLPDAGEIGAQIWDIFDKDNDGIWDPNEVKIWEESWNPSAGVWPEFCAKYPNYAGCPKT